MAETRYVSPLPRALVYAGLGDAEAFCEWADRAYENRSGDLALIRGNVFGDAIEGDPRFAELMRRIGLEP